MEFNVEFSVRNFVWHVIEKCFFFFFGDLCYINTRHSFRYDRGQLVPICHKLWCLLYLQSEAYLHRGSLNWVKSRHSVCLYISMTGPLFKFSVCVRKTSHTAVITQALFLSKEATLVMIHIYLKLEDVAVPNFQESLENLNTTIFCGFQAYQSCKKIYSDIYIFIARIIQPLQSLSWNG